jgi:hypothetical protein
MYKKIQHNIVEEHFDNIAAYQCGGNANVAMTTQHISAGVFSGGENSAMAVALKSEIKDYFSKYLMYVRNYIIGKISGDMSATAESKKILDQHVQKLPKPLGSFFSLEDMSKIVSALANLTSRILIVVDEMSENKNTDVSQLALDKEINSFATQLYNVAPNQWPVQSLVNLLSSVTNSIIDQTRARVNKNWSEDAAAFDRSVMYLVTNTFPELSFSDALAKGIIYLRPNRFDASNFG